MALSTSNGSTTTEVRGNGVGIAPWVPQAMSTTPVTTCSKTFRALAMVGPFSTSMVSVPLDSAVTLSAQG